MPRGTYRNDDLQRRAEAVLAQVREVIFMRARELRMSEVKLARAAGVSRTEIRHIRAGRNFGVLILLRLAFVLGLDEFIGRRFLLPETVAHDTLAALRRELNAAAESTELANQHAADAARAMSRVLVMIGTAQLDDREP